MVLFDEFIPVFALALAALVFIGIMMLLSHLTRPRVPQSEAKLSTYECGEEPITDRIGFQLNYQYFVYAIVFTGLDILAVFLYSWAVSNNRINTETLILISTFVGLIMLAFIYVALTTRKWKNIRYKGYFIKASKKLSVLIFFFLRNNKLDT